MFEPELTTFKEYYTYLADNGITIYPRGQKTAELRDVSFKLESGYIPRRPGDNPAIGIMEGLQFVGGIFDKDAIAAVAPNARLDLFTKQAAYGPRVGKQLVRVISSLKADPFTRQAVITLPRWSEELFDRPCTSTLQFRKDVEHDELDVSINMRSSDAVWGLPYDIIQFSMMLYAVSGILRMNPRHLIFHLGSSHIYEATHVDPSDWREGALQSHLYESCYGETVDNVQASFRAAALGGYTGRQLIDEFTVDHGN